MPLQVTPGGQELSRKFKEAAHSGSYDDAFDALQQLSLHDALVSCADAAGSDYRSFFNLSMLSGTDKGHFAVQLMTTGAMPFGGFAGLTADDYNTARVFLLQVREEKPKAAAQWDAGWGCSHCPFYPERVRGVVGRRDRVCAIAEAHAGKGPGTDEQTTLFSLGGLYNYRTAKAGTHPAGGATTCILVARSILHAAGCNVIGPWTSRGICMVPMGLFGELPRAEFGYVRASEYDNGMRPQRGDIFHIKGANFKDADGVDTGKDSTHVGLIVNVVGPDTWETVEGGGSDHVTSRKSRTLMDVSSSYGKKAFTKDETSAAVRPLQGWYSIDRITGRWMQGA